MKTGNGSNQCTLISPETQKNTEKKVDIKQSASTSHRPSREFDSHWVQLVQIETRLFQCLFKATWSLQPSFADNYNCAVGSILSEGPNKTKVINNNIKARACVNMDITSRPCRLRLQNTPTASLQRRKITPPTNGLDMTLNNLIVRPQAWRFGECGIPLHCHRYQAHFGPEW